MSRRFSGSLFLKITLTMLPRDTVTGSESPGRPSSWAVSLPFSSVTVMPIAGLRRDSLRALVVDLLLRAGAFFRQRARRTVVGLGGGMRLDRALTVDGHHRTGADETECGNRADAGDDALLQAGLRGEEEAPEQGPDAPAMMNTTGPPLLSIHSMIRENE